MGVCISNSATAGGGDRSAPQNNPGGRYEVTNKQRQPEKAIDGGDTVHMQVPPETAGGGGGGAVVATAADDASDASIDSSDGQRTTENKFTVAVRVAAKNIHSYVMHGINSDADQFDEEISRMNGVVLSNSRRKFVVTWIDDHLQAALRDHFISRLADRSILAGMMDMSRRSVMSSGGGSASSSVACGAALGSDGSTTDLMQEEASAGSAAGGENSMLIAESVPCGDGGLGQPSSLRRTTATDEEMVNSLAPPAAPSAMPSRTSPTVSATSEAPAPLNATISYPPLPLAPTAERELDSTVHPNAVVEEPDAQHHLNNTDIPPPLRGAIPNATPEKVTPNLTITIPKPLDYSAIAAAVVGTKKPAASSSVEKSHAQRADPLSPEVFDIEPVLRPAADDSLLLSPPLRGGQRTSTSTAAQQHLPFSPTDSNAGLYVNVADLTPRSQLGSVAAPEMPAVVLQYCIDMDLIVHVVNEYCLKSHGVPSPNSLNGKKHLNRRGKVVSLGDAIGAFASTRATPDPALLVCNEYVEMTPHLRVLDRPAKSPSSSMAGSLSAFVNHNNSLNSNSIFSDGENSVRPFEDASDAGESLLSPMSTVDMSLSPYAGHSTPWKERPLNTETLRAHNKIFAAQEKQQQQQQQQQQSTQMSSSFSSQQMSGSLLGGGRFGLTSSSSPNQKTPMLSKSVGVGGDSGAIERRPKVLMQLIFGPPILSHFLSNAMTKIV